MTSGLPNDEKAAVRQRYAAGEIGREELLEAESASYHSAGTCTFYGTANSNQMLMEVMGLHLPGAELRQPRHAAARCPDRRRSRPGDRPDHLGRALHAGRTHRRREGDRQRLRRAARHGRLDQPHAAPGRDRPRRGDHAHLGRPVRPVGRRTAAGPGLPQRQGRREPLPRGRRAGVHRALAAEGGLLHDDVQTVAGHGLWRYTTEARLVGSGADAGRRAPSAATTPTCSAAPTTPSPPTAACGCSTASSAGPSSRPRRSSRSTGRSRRRRGSSTTRPTSWPRSSTARSRATSSRCVRFQGPAANGMPELHKLTPALGRAAGPRPARRAGHRRAHVRRVRQGARGDPPDPRGLGRRTALAGAGRRPDHPRRRRRPARPARSPTTSSTRASAQAPTTRASSGPDASCSTPSAPASAPRTRAPACSPTHGFTEDLDD